MTPEAHVHIFSVALQISGWIDCVQGWTETVEDEDATRHFVTKERSVLAVKQKSLFR